MQRDSTNQTAFIIIIAILAVIYESLSTIYSFLPPLFGLTILALFYRPKESTFYLLLFYLLLFESDHMLITLSTLLFAWIIIKIIMPFIEEIIACKICLHTISIALSYFGFFMLSSLFSFIWGINTGMHYDYLALLYFVVVETLFSVILL
jgi:hypothetical protein